MANKIQYEMQFKTDGSLQKVRQELQDILNITQGEFNELNKGKGFNASQLTHQLKLAKDSAIEIQNALDRSFNTDLGSLNVSKFNQELKQLELNEINKRFQTLGALGPQAFRDITSQAISTNLQLKKTHHFMEEMKTTMFNTIKWGVTSSAMNAFTGSIQKAYSYVKDLDTSLNNIRIVTGKSAEEMDRFAKIANKTAASLGKSTKDYTDAALIYYQQGLEGEEVQARTETTLKAANVTGQSASEVSEQLTAVWNGYKVSAEETELYVDKLAAVAASTATDLEELSTGISKVASAAKTAGVDIDQLNAQVATITSVTREAPETVGNSLKTMYARFGDLAIEGEDEFGVSLGKVSGQLQAVGVQILDDSGNMREMGEIFEDLAEKWNTWTAGQKQAVAVAVAGKMQYSRLITLMENWDMYENALETSQNAMGTLQEQQDIYMESTEAHLEQLSTAWEKVYSSMFDSDAFKGIIDAVTFLVNQFGDLINSIGGAKNAFMLLGSTILKVLGKQLSQGIATSIMNIKAVNKNLQQAKDNLKNIESLKDQTKDINSIFQNRLDLEANVETLYIKKLIDEEEYNRLKATIESVTQLRTKLAELQEQEKQVNESIINPLFETGLIKVEKGVETDLNKIEEKAAEFRAQGFQPDEAYKKSGGETLVDSLGKQKKAYKELQKTASDFFDDVVKNNEVGKLDLRVLKEKAKLYRGIVDQVETITETNNLFDDETYGDEMRDQVEKISKFFAEVENDNLVAVNFSYDNIINKIKDFSSYFSSYITGILEKIDTAEEKAKKAGKGTSYTFKKPGDEQAAALKDFFDEKQLQERIQNYVNSVAGVLQVVSAFESLKNIINIVSDDTLSFGEKIKQVFMAFSTSVLTLIQAMNTLSQSALGAWLAQKLGIEAATKSLQGFILFSGQILLITGLIAGAIGLVSEVVEDLSASINKEENAAKAAAENAKALEERYKELSQTAQELKENITGYEEAVKGLENLNTGTEEYEKKLEETNEQAKQLIETLGLYDKYDTDKRGVIQINREALREAQEKADKEAQDAKIEQYFGKIRANETRLNLEKSNYDFLDNGLILFSRSVEESAKEIEALAESVEEVTKVNKYYVEQIIDATTEKQFGNIFEEFVNQFSTRNKDELYSSLMNTQSSLMKDLGADDYARDVANIDVSDITKKKHLKKNYSEYSDLENGADLVRRYLIKTGRVDWDTLNNNVKIKGAGWDTIEGVTLKDTGETVLGKTEVSTIVQELAYLEELEKIQRKYERKMEEYGDQTSIRLQELAIRGKNFGKEFGVDFSIPLIDAVKTGELDFSSLANSLTADERQKILAMDSKEIAKILAPEVPQSEDDLIGDKLMTSAQVKQRSLFASLEDEENVTDSLNKIESIIEENFKQAIQELPAWNAADAVAAAIARKNEDLEIAGDDLTKKQFEELQEEVQVYAENLMEVARNSEDVSEELSKNEDAAVDLALRVVRMNRGIENLADNFKDWSDVLNNSTDYSQEYAEAMVGIKDAIADIYDIEAKYVSNKFVIEHLKELKQVAEGDADAIDGLRTALASDIVMKIGIDNNWNEEKIKFFQNEITTWGQRLQDELSQLDIGEIDISGATESLNRLFQESKMTVEQANAILATYGVEPVYTQDYVDQEQVIERSQTVRRVREDEPFTDSDGNEWAQTTTIEEVTPLPPEKTMVHIPVTAIKSDGTMPTIKGVRKSATGAMSNYSSVNKGGGSAGKSSGGGGSSKPSKEDKLDDKTDPYHDVNIRIKNVSNDLDKLDKQQKKFFGQKLVNNLNNQYELLQKQIGNYQEKLQIAKKEQNRLQKELLNQGVSFNTSDGTIANYEQIYNEKLNNVNALIEKYNGMSANEQENFKDTLEDEKENFKKFKETLEEYDTTLTETIPEIEANIQDAIDKQIEINITKFNMEIEMRLNLKEAELEWNKFKKKILDQINDENIFGNAFARLTDFSSYYKTDNKGIVQATTTQVQGTLAQLQQMDATGWSTVYGNNRTQALEDLQKYYKELMSQLEEVAEIQEDIHKAYLDMMDEAQEKFNEQLDTYEQISKIIEHDMKLIQLVRGEEFSYEELTEYYEKQTENYKQQLDFQKKTTDFWKNQMDVLDKEVQLRQAERDQYTQGSEAWKNANTEYERAVEKFEAARDQWTDAVETWHSSVEDAVENVQDKYLNAINNIFDKLNKKVTNGLGLDYVKEQQDLIKQVNEQFLDPVNAIYGIQQLENKYKDAIDASDSLPSQKRLNDLMNKELDMLREKDKLSQYDLDRANLRYEIALKQIALEEAQQNKSQLRLRRDSQGNYSYQFVSDEDEIGQIRDELADLYNQLYNLDLDAYRENLDEALDLWTEFQEKMKEAAQINDPEERQKRELLLQQYYGELINNTVGENELIKQNLYQSTLSELFTLYDQNVENYDSMTQAQQELLNTYLDTQYETSNAAFNNLFDLYDASIVQFENMTDSEIDILMNSFIPEWESGIQQMADVFAGEEGFLGVCKNAMENLRESTQEYETDLQDVFNYAGLVFDEIANGTDSAINKTQGLLTINDKLISQYDQEIGRIQNVQNQLGQLIGQYQKAKDAAVAATEAAYKYWAAQQQQQLNMNSISKNSSNSIISGSNKTSIATNKSGSGGGSGGSGSSGGGFGGTNNDNGSNFIGKDLLTNLYNNLNKTKPSMSIVESALMLAVNKGTANLINEAIRMAETIGVKNLSPFYQTYYKQLKDKQFLTSWRGNSLASFDTGGYTGDWGTKASRLALVHEKELVLNKQDTPNLLNAVYLLRDIVDNVGSSVFNRASKFNNRTNVNGSIAAGTQFEQNVHIEASFPNATSSKEIEEAFHNLTNIASQRVYRNRE